MVQSWMSDLLGVFQTVKTEISNFTIKEPCCEPAKKDFKNILEAAASGSQSSFREFVLQNGITDVTAADPEGNTPAHFAALHNHLDILECIANAAKESDGVLDLTVALNSVNKSGVAPLHWACVAGNLAVVDYLLNSGVAQIDQQDGKGYTPLITASQYGKANVCLYLLGRGANINVCDNDDDSALHWACSKGKADIIRLLIFHGLDVNARDNFNQTPLHFACLSGDLNCVRDLCIIDQVDINIKDNNAKTPLMLAAGRRHEIVVAFLKSEILRRRSPVTRATWRSYVLGDPGHPRNAMLFFLLAILLWGYPYYIFRMLPATYAIFPNLHYTFFLFNVLMWILYFRCVTSDPGFIDKNMLGYFTIVKEAAQYGDWERSSLKGENPLSALCHTCCIVKPPRSKHCRKCDRCVLECDHHCPYITNCVGLKNRHWFGYFVLVMCYLGLVGVYMLWHTWSITGTDIVNVFCLLFVGFGVMVVVMTNICVWYHATSNLTTNESVNWKRYSYLKGPHGHFRNRYNRGCWLNLAEFLHIVPSQTSQKGHAWQEDKMTGWSTGKPEVGAVVHF